MLRPLMLGFSMIGALTSSSFADVASYGKTGTENPLTYSFTASGGDVSAYFAGTDANFVDSIGLLVNGVDTGITGLLNHGPSLGIGEELDFGSIAAGSTLVFYVKVADSDIGQNLTYYSASSMNSDGTGHIYAYNTTKSAVWNAEVGTYIGFEDSSPLYDQAFSGSDYNYIDEQFIVTGVTLSSSVPEISTWAMILAGFAALGSRSFWGRNRRLAFAD